MASSQSLRVFLAIPPTPDQCAELAQQLCRLKTKLSSPSLHWIPEENWHITLKFMGNTEPQKIAPLISALKEELHKRIAFSLKLTHFDWFPNTKSPIVLAAIPEPDESLSRLAASIDKKLSRYGFEPETRVFRPHLSLAHTPAAINVDDARQLPIVMTPMLMRVNKFDLKQSTSKKQSVYYSKLASFALLS